MAKKRIRIRSKRLDQLDESKLALAVWLIARDLVEQGVVADKTTPSVASEGSDDHSTPAGETV